VSGGTGVIRAAGVVVPAHDEQTLLPACLAALRHAAEAVSVPVHLLVVADACSDRTGFGHLLRTLADERRRVGDVQPGGVRQ
jgi:hypothetical protein